MGNDALIMVDERIHNGSCWLIFYQWQAGAALARGWLGAFKVCIYKMGIESAGLHFVGR